MTQEEKALKFDLLAVMRKHKVELVGYEEFDGQNQEYNFEGDNITLNIFHLMEEIDHEI